jgi:hypothetical protein
MSDLVESVCAVATRSHLAGHGFGPLLVLRGPNGSAVLRHDPTEPDLICKKARLMALALQADACVLVSETVLRFSGGVSLNVVLLLTKDRDGLHTDVFAPRRIAGHVALGPVRTRLAGPVPAGVLDRLVHDVLPKTAEEGDVHREWVSLERMGVMIARDTRRLH